MPIEEALKPEEVILRLSSTLDRESEALTRRVGKLVYDETRAITGKRFYSLPQLRKMGFPYSKKFPKDFLMDDRIINLQSGGLHNSLRWSYVYGKWNKTVTVWSIYPAISKIVGGTQRARPRNFFSLALERAKSKVSGEEKRFLDRMEGRVNG